jgi:hypothetical protein
MTIVQIFLMGLVAGFMGGMGLTSWVLNRRWGKLLNEFADKYCVTKDELEIIRKELKKARERVQA